MRVVSEPAVLRASVRAGFAVTTFHPSGRGGLTHLPFGLLTSEVDRRRLTTRLQSYLAQLPHEQLRGDIIGGADLLGVYPSDVHRRRMSENAALMEVLLTELGVKVRHVEVGGTETRQVAFWLPEGRLELSRMDGPSGPSRALSTAPSDTGPIMVGMGEMGLGSSGQALGALLGSCVGVILYDRHTHAGALAHVMNPLCPTDGQLPFRYADSAIPALVDALVGAGAVPRQLQAKLAGGARVLGGDSGIETAHVADMNILHVRHALQRANISCVAEDLGGTEARRVLFDLNDFSLQIKMISSRTRKSL